MDYSEFSSEFSPDQRARKAQTHAASLREAGINADAVADRGTVVADFDVSQDPRLHYRAHCLGMWSIGAEPLTYAEWCEDNKARSGLTQRWFDAWEA